MEYNEMIEEYVRNFANKTGDRPKVNPLSGTTVLALKYKDGTVIAGDMRMCKGPMEISSETFEKIFQINNGNVLIAVAGTVAIALQVIKSLNLEIEYYEKIEETELSFEAKANLLSQILTKLFPLAANGIGVSPILASKSKIYAYDELGAKWEVNCQIVGSGAPFTVTDFKRAWHEGLTRNEAVKIAVETLKKANEVNPFTGPDMVIYVIEDSAVKLSKEEVKKIIGGD